MDEVPNRASRARRSALIWVALAVAVAASIATWAVQRDWRRLAADLRFALGAVCVFEVEIPDPAPVDVRSPEDVPQWRRTAEAILTARGALDSAAEALRAALPRDAVRTRPARRGLRIFVGGQDEREAQIRCGALLRGGTAELGQWWSMRYELRLVTACRPTTAGEVAPLLGSAVAQWAR